MLTPQIISYVQAQLAQGVGEEKIAADLSKVGWSSTDIAAIFDQLHASAALTTPPAPLPIPNPSVMLRNSSIEEAPSLELGMSNTKRYVLTGIVGVVVFLLGVGIGYVYTLHPVLAHFFSK